MSAKKRFDRVVTTNMAETTVERVERIATSENISLSEAMRNLVHEGLRARGLA